MPKKVVLAVLLTLVMVMAAPAYAQDATPPFPTWPTATRAVEQGTQPSVRTVTAIVVKSWGDNPVWADLNTNWSTYGKIAVSVDHTSLIKSDFTYQDLVNSQADVVIISDAAGGLQQYSSAEMAAIAKYAKQQHPIIATYATLEYNSYDNRGLAPLFGLDSTLTYTTTGISNKFKEVTCSCLLKNIPGPWQSNGYNYSQVPSSGSWTGNLGTAKAVADSDTFVGVITVHTTKTSAGVYISNMPEYENVGGDDEQLLYNAIICYAKRGTK